jgi:hypothetical protein
MNRVSTRKAQRLVNDPVVQELIAEISTNAFAGFIRNAFTNRPEEIDAETWGMTVELVMKAGKTEVPIIAEGFEIKELPKKRRKKTDDD